MSNFKKFNSSDQGRYRTDHVGREGELTWDTENGLRLHDGSTQGGNPVTYNQNLNTTESVKFNNLALTGNISTLNTSLAVSVGPYDGSIQFEGYIDNGTGGAPGATLHVTNMLKGTITDGMTIYGPSIPGGLTLGFGTVVLPHGTGGTGNYYLPGANYLTGTEIFSDGTQPPKTCLVNSSGTVTFPPANNSQVSITGATRTVPGNPYSVRSAFSSEYQIWQASSVDVVAAKVTVRLHNDYYTYTELFEVMLCKEATNNANVSYSLGARIKSDESYPDGVVDVRLDGSNKLTLYYTSIRGDASFYTFDAVEFTKTV